MGEGKKIERYKKNAKVQATRLEHHSTILSFKQKAELKKITPETSKRNELPGL